MSDFQKYLDQNLGKVVINSNEDEIEDGTDDIYKVIREMVLKTRNEAGITQKQLAEKSGLTQSSISNLEKGNSIPTIESLKKIADAFGKKLMIEFADWEEEE